jgi:hypothetical protein
MGALERRPGKETKLHHKTEDSSEDESECGPGDCGTQALPQDFPENDDDVEEEHQQKTVRDEDAGQAGCSDEDMLEVERRKDRADEKDDEEQDELEDGKDGIFHG